jgi:hypothetical protein
MATLQTNELIKGLESVKAFSPFLIDDDILKQHIQQARQDYLSLDKRDKSTMQLMELIEPQRIFLKQTKQDKLLNGTEVYCLPYPLPMAYCTQVDDRDIIIVGQGLIDLISYTIHCAHFENTIPLHFSSYHSLKYRRDMPFTELVSNCLFLFALRFYCYAEPIPDIYTLLTEQQKEDSKIAISGALLFIILHELGHIQLGHLDGHNVRPSVKAKLIHEELNSTRQIELEADAFAIRSLIEPAQEAGQYWCSMAMSFFSNLELISGTQHDTHPLAINRRFVSANSANTGEHFSKLAKRYNDTRQQEQSFEGKLYDTNREGSLKVLQEINQVLESSGIKINFGVTDK